MEGISSEDPQAWHEYRKSRNHENNEIKKAKASYFTTNLDLHNWSIRIEKISKKIDSAIGALKRIRPYVTTDTAI